MGQDRHQLAHRAGDRLGSLQRVDGPWLPARAGAGRHRHRAPWPTTIEEKVVELQNRKRALFDAVVDSHGAHLAMNLHFLLSGYLFYWVVIGVDPTPRPIPPLAKLGVVFASLPLHAFFGVVLMGMSTVLGADFYRSLKLDWHTDLLGDQKLGGGIAWAAGEVPLVIVLIALFVQWRRSDQRTATRLDRAAERDDDADLAAYNAMLAEMARRDRAGN